MRELLSTLVKVVVAFVIAGILINDTAAYIYSRYDGEDKAVEVARTFALEYNQSASVGSALNKAGETATSMGVNLVSYSIEGKTVEVNIELDAEKTAIIQRVKSLKELARVKVSATAELNR